MGATLSCHPAVAAPEASSFRDIVVDRRALPLNPRRGGRGYGRSFLAEREISATEARHQGRVAALERAAGVR